MAVIKIITVSDSGKTTVPNWGITEYQAKNFVGSKRSATYTINGVSCVTYEYKYPGPPYMSCPTGSPLYRSKTGYFFKDSSYPRFRPNNFASSSNYLTPNYQIAFWVVYNNYWYLLYEEENLTENFYDNHSFSYAPKSVDIYETFDFEISGTSTQHRMTLNSKEGTETTSTVSYNSFSAAASYFGLNDSLKPTGNQYTSPGTKTISGDWKTAYFTITISVADFSSKEYKIIENSGTCKVYVGKEIESDFLNHFSLVYVQKNDYKEKQTIIETSISKENLSKTKWSYTDTNIQFTYTYKENKIQFESSYRVIQLAPEPSRYNHLSIKTSYKQGEIFDGSSINIRQSGYLLYEDGTTISLDEIDYLSDPTVSSTLSKDPCTLDESILGFNVTYTIPTQYFGILTYNFHVLVEGQTEDYIVRVELIDAKTSFSSKDTIDFGQNAKLVCYNYNDEIIKTIKYSQFNQYITTYPKNYGKKVPNSFYVDAIVPLPFKFQTFRDVSWNILVDYISPTLILDSSKVKRKYFIGGKYGDTILLDKTNLVAKVNIHRNTQSIGFSEQLDVSNLCTLSSEQIDVLTGTRVYSVKVTYSSEEFDQKVESSFDISVSRYEATTIEITGNNDSNHYWDNNLDLFHYPVGLSFFRIYSDGSSELIEDLSSLEFYRDANLTKKLNIGYSIIKESDGQRIYVLDPITKVSGSYIIYFDEDKIISVLIENTVPFVLGNRFNSIRDQLSIKAIYASGNEDSITSYSFKNNNIILEEEDITIIVDQEEYTLDNSKITFIKPQISKIDIDSSDFSLTYNNISDGINANKLLCKIHYANAEFVQTCNYKNGKIIENDYEFLVSCSEMPDFNFDGSQVLEIDMGEFFEKTLTLSLTVRNRFDHSDDKNTSASLNVKVIEITEITGISLLNVYTNYNVNDLFLNENDTTEVQIYYKDSSGIQKKLQVKLNSGFSALNIFPLKGTKFYNITNSRTVKITSATNYNVSCEYTISVGSKYIYSTTKLRNLVAIYQNSFELPNGEKMSDKYVLIERADSDGNENTKITNEGERVLADGKIIENIQIWGYIEDAFDDTKNARIIFFNDYIPPIEGTNNITVKFPCYVRENADKINKCRFGILFGNNNAKNRLFLSGNAEIPNCDWHSGQIDSTYLEDESMINGNFGYFEDTSYCYYGETDNSIVGYDIVANDRLLVLKNESDKETTIYYRTPVLVAAIDGAGNSMTGIDGETLYQEEFSLIKSNNAVAGISQKAIANLNGDTLFISNENKIVGLDLTGIIGDNQRSANTRSYYIDEELKKYDLSNAKLWTNNKYLYVVLKDKIFITHYETKNSETNQYEWWLVNIADIQAILEVNDTKYMANSKGQFYRVSPGYDDISKVFIGTGGSLLITEGENNDEIIVSKQIIENLDEEKKYTFKIIPGQNEDTSFIYYKLGSISNVKGPDKSFDFYIHSDKNCIELLGFENGKSNYQIINSISNRISEKRVVYLNHPEGENEIAAFPNSPIKTPYKKYYLKKYTDDSVILLNDCYKLYDFITETEVNISDLYRADICYKLDGEYVVANINKKESSFQLMENDVVLNLVRYSDQDISKQFKAEILSYMPVEAYYITKPFDMGSLNYFKTIWGWTLTNDTQIESELEIAFASNKIPFESMRTLASISKDKFGLDFNDLNFSKFDLEKSVVPRTYTNHRVLSQMKFICFGFRNFNNTNAVLSSMSIIYTIPFPSYSGD